MRKHRTTLLAGMTAVLALGVMAPAAAAEPTISSPGAGEIVYWNTLELAGSDVDAAANTVQWAVREDTCAASTGTVAGNVDGYSDSSTWSGGFFSASLDISTWSAGEYCFVLNTTSGPATGARQTQLFYVVDEYVKVGGTLYMGGMEKGMSPTHALDGVVGDAGAAGIVGWVTVNYRELSETVTYWADSLGFRTASGIGATDPMAVAEIGTTTGATILVLDADATAAFPRGAIIVRAEGAPSMSDYEIDATPGTTGADSWVAMDRGNNHTGIR